MKMGQNRLRKEEEENYFEQRCSTFFLPPPPVCNLIRKSLPLSPYRGEEGKPPSF